MQRGSREGKQRPASPSRFQDGRERQPSQEMRVRPNAGIEAIELEGGCSASHERNRTLNYVTEDHRLTVPQCFDGAGGCPYDEFSWQRPVAQQARGAAFHHCKTGIVSSGLA